MKLRSRIIVEDIDWTTDTQKTMESFPVTRSAKGARNQLQVAQESDESSAVTHNQMQEAQGISAIHTPAGETIVSGDRLTEEHGMSSAPLYENGTIRWTNVPRKPIPPLDDINLWVGHQLNHKRLPKEYKHMSPEG
jgi:hypothetical protein